MQRSPAIDAMADVIGIVTVGIGAGLSVAPVRFGRLLGMAGQASRSRALGVADLALGTAILVSGRVWPRRRWPSLIGREVLHLVIADDYRRRRNRKGMAAMAGLFLVDGIVTVLMHEVETRR